MKRRIEISEKRELPELPQELWNLIVNSIEINKMPSDLIMNVEKLSLWINLSRVCKTLQRVFEWVKENDVLLKEIYPIYPLKNGVNLTYPYFSIYIQQEQYGSYDSGNMKEWLSIASSSERFHKISGMNEIISQIKSFSIFMASNLKRYST